MTRIAGAVVLLALPVLAQSEVLSPAYEAAVRRYASGDRDGAIADLCGWPEGSMRDEIATFRRKARSDGLWPGTAALMLHTDCALRARRDGTSPRLHESAALALVGFMKDDPARRAFARTWYGAMASLALRENRWDEALAWAERGLRDFPDSVEMLLVESSVEEILGAQAGPAVSDQNAPDVIARQERSRLLQLHEARDHLERAARAARAAAATQPSLPEARLRLGHVAWRLGETDKARSALEEALARSRDGGTAYLAHLFLGRLDEDAGHLEVALRSYEAALALDPRCQSARLAISHVHLRLGDGAGARHDVETAVKPAGYRAQPDPFWLYPWGPSVDVKDRLEALRREASP